MNKDALVILLLGLVLTWLLLSSVNTMKTPVLTGSQSSPGLRGIPSINIYPELPVINLTFTYTINSSLSGIFTIPLIPMPIVIPNMAVNLTVMNTPAIMAENKPGTTSLNNGISQGSGSVNNNINSMVVSLHLPKIFIIILLMVIITIAIIMGALSIKDLREVRHASGTRLSSQNQLPPTGLKVRKTEMKPQESLIRTNYENAGIDLLPRESIAPLHGWGGSSLIRFPIPTDLPLIWHVGFMPIESSGNANIIVKPTGNITKGSIQFPVPGCYELLIKDNETQERWTIRITNYDEDIIRLMKLNNPSVNVSSTVREDLMKLAKENSLDRGLVMMLINTFEKAKYGLKPIGRDEYENYLRVLKIVFPNARVIICE